jgi:DNA polymerase-3 subunit gamma/tau
MEYTVLARRFRPQSFGEVIGQETIAEALRNAIAANRVAHAYLFTGARGVGKTSTARILAKSLNCPNARGGDPCNQCDVCQGISAGSDVDVIEIDGASNRGIEEIRTLRANVNVKPMRCRYKIYIIDEVHMLTKEAFNALLKTLEEPPGNVKFIFCTTDPQKVPDTILSRCQRFDFGTIATATIGARLAEIAAAEGVEVDPAAIELVARRAAGSLRDSQSLFDQLLAFGGKKIAAADVHRLLGTAPDERLVDIARALVARDRRRVLELLDAALLSGVQVGELTDQLVACFRDLMILAGGAEQAALLSVSEGGREALMEQAKAAGLQTVLAGLQILTETKFRMKGVAFSRVLLELALIRISTLDQLEGLSDLVVQLRQGKGAERPVPGVGRNVPPAPKSASSLTEPALGSRGAPLPGHLPKVAPRGSERPEGGENPEAYAPASPGDGERSSAEEVVGQPITSVEPAAAIPFEPGRESEIWTQVLSDLSDMAKANAKNVCGTAISGPNKLVLAFPRSYHLSKQYFERSPEQLGKIERALERVVGRVIRVDLALDETEVIPRGGEEHSRKERESAGKGAAERDPLVQRALSVFQAAVVRVETSS